MLDDICQRKTLSPIFVDGVLLFTAEISGIVLSQPWSHPAILNQGPLDWKSSSLNTRSMQDEMQIKLFKNEQLTSLTPEWRYW